MGSITGHVLAGIPYVLLSIRWTYCLLLRFFLCRRELTLGKKNPKRFRSTITFPWSCIPNWPVDAMMLFCPVVFQIVGEFITAFMVEFGFIMNVQHIAVLFYMALASFSLILKHYKMLSIPDMEYALFTLCGMMQAFAVFGHIVGKTSMEGQVHMYIVYSILFNAISFVFEAQNRENVLVSLCRIVSMGVSGWWLIIIGFILFTPLGSTFDQESHVDMKIIMIIFMWVVAGNVLMALFLGMLAVVRVRNMTLPEMHEALETSCCSNLSKNDVEQCQYMLVYSDDDI